MSAYHHQRLGFSQADQQVATAATGLAVGATTLGLIASGAMAGSVLPVIGTVIGAAFGLVMALIHHGYDPQKLNDTAVTEALELEMHQLWYLLTGEDLGGGGGSQCNCSPGRCGAQHCAIFGIPTQYPNVPDGPSGNPDIDVNVAIAQVQRLSEEGMQHLVRPESMADYQNNVGYMMGLFRSVAAARAVDPAYTSALDVGPGAIADVTRIFSGLPSWLPWAAIAAAVYAIL